MVIKGCSRGGAAALAVHLQRADTNEKVELRELRGVAAEDLLGGLREIEAVACGARSKRPFYHASINTRADEILTPEQWTTAIDRLEKELGLTGQPRAVVAHLKEGRAHVHIAWSRIEIDTLKAISDSHNYRQHEIVARELEREFGHARVQGAHIEREGKDRPERTPSHAEMQQADRSGLTPHEAKTLLTEIWNRTDSGQAFAAAIKEQGWILARGDRRDFVVLDPDGEAHSLGRRIEGAKAKDVRARMSDIEAPALPSVSEAKALHRVREMAAEHQAGRLEIQPSMPPAHLGRIVSEEEREREHHPAKATTNASMVAQQQEAQRRFEHNSADLEAQRADRRKRLEELLANKGTRNRDERGPHDRTLEKDGLKR